MLRWLLTTTCLLGGCLDPPPLKPRAPTPGVPYLTISSFNVELHQYGDPDTIEAIGHSGADIIALQETNPRWEAVIRARYGREYPYMAFTGGGSSGLAVLSRLPFESRDLVDGLDDWHPAWHLLMESPIGPLQLLMVHLRPPYSRRSGVAGIFNVDEDHQREIQAFIAPCDRELPTIVLGDFNESVDGAGIAVLEDRGFANVLPQFRPRQETWRYGRSLYGQTVDTLDHILYQTEHFEPLNAFVKYVGNSDHLPVTALFEAAR